MRFRSSSRCSRNDIRPPIVVIVVRLVVGRLQRPGVGAGKRHQSHGPGLRQRSGALVGRLRRDRLIAAATRCSGRQTGAAVGALLLGRLPLLAAPRSGLPLRACSSSSLDARLNSFRLRAERPAQLGQLLGPKDDQSDHEDDDQLWHADGTKHGTPAFCEAGRDLGQRSATRPNYRTSPCLGQGRRSPASSPEVVADAGTYLLASDHATLSVPFLPSCSRSRSPRSSAACSDAGRWPSTNGSRRATKTFTRR